MFEDVVGMVQVQTNLGVSILENTHSATHTYSALNLYQDLPNDHVVVPNK